MRDSYDVLRRTLLLMAGNPVLWRTLPRFGFVRRAAHRFLAGEDVTSALVAAERCAQHGIGAVLTHLGRERHLGRRTMCDA